MAQLSLSKIRKSFGVHEVIKGIDLEVADGEFVVFVGPSGCGKSTMLRMISGLEESTSGRMMIDGVDVTHIAPSKRGIAMVFQSYALFPHMTVGQNIGFGLKLAKASKAEITRQVLKVAEVLQIVPLLERTPRELSGGQRQRVAIGRAIIRDPKIFLFDEPLSNLDAALRVQMRLEIARLHARLAATMVYVTHDQTEAMTLADRIVVFNGGRIEQVGAPMELYANPANLFVAGFIGAPAMNFFPATLGDGYPYLAGSESPVSVPVSGTGPVTLGARPEHLSICNLNEADFVARVEIIEHLGAETFAYLQADCTASSITLRVPDHAKLAVADQIGICFDRAHLHVFDASGSAVRR